MLREHRNEHNGPQELLRAFYAGAAPRVMQYGNGPGKSSGANPAPEIRPWRLHPTCTQQILDL
ncbi:hypothetical protein ACIQYW_31550 [Rhodococcus erythropolis]|uniref:hypothetical protein n=1 Tax=Rhodococcus erythropolis group TaxID=2840174 RepID=UPI0033983D68